MKLKRWLTTLAVVLLLGGAIYHASRHVATGPAAGIALEGLPSRPPTGRSTLRIAAFNIHSCKGADGRRDLQRVAECIGDFDFVALGEVRGRQTFQSKGQAERLGQRLGMAWLFTPAVRTWYHLESGNGLLSSVPVSFWQRIPLPRKYERRSHRNGVLVGLNHGQRTVHVLLTHITRRDDRDRHLQLRAVIALYLSLAEPAVLLGDMNSRADDPQIRRLLQTPGVVDPVAEVLGKDAPPGRIDWIFARGFRCLDAGIEENDASDHPVVWAELEPFDEGEKGTGAFFR